MNPFSQQSESERGEFVGQTGTPDKGVKSLEKAGTPLCSIVGSVLSLIGLVCLSMLGMFVSRSHGGHEWDGMGETIIAIPFFIIFVATELVGILILVAGVCYQQKLAYIVLPLMILAVLTVLSAVPLPLK